jgi:hypothetical protein
MYLVDVDVTEAIARGRQNDYSEVYHRLPVKSGRELG